MMMMMIKKLIVATLFIILFVHSAFALQATLTWGDSPNETGYRVTRSDNGGPFVEQTQVAMNVTSFNQNTGLVSGTVYCYQVIAFGALGDAPQPWPQICGTAPDVTVNASGLSLVFQP
jgi:hypothetical protein